MNKWNYSDALHLEVHAGMAHFVHGLNVLLACKTVFSLIDDTYDYYYYAACALGCLQCFDAVGWAAGRASGL